MKDECHKHKYDIDWKKDPPELWCLECNKLLGTRCACCRAWKGWNCYCVTCPPGKSPPWWSQIPVIALLLLAQPCLGSTIATDGKSMAGDSQITHGNTSKTLAPNGKVEKINGFIVGCVGDCADIKRFKQWFRQPNSSRPELDDLSALVLSKQGVWEYDETLIPTRVKVPVAIGTGKVAAMAAMKAGASVKKAVAIAAELDIYTSLPVTELTP